MDPPTLSTPTLPSFCVWWDKQFLQCQYINHITSSPLPPIQWLHRVAFQDVQDHPQHHPRCKNIHGRSSPRSVVHPHWPKMPSPREILYNRAIQCQGSPSMPIDIEAVQNHLYLRSCPRRSTLTNHIMQSCHQSLLPTRNYFSCPQ